jgi:L-aspartate oxidase
MAFPPRYLTAFGPNDTSHLLTDVVIIGAGIAGLRAALEIPAELRVLVITKDKVQLSNSAWAQGGIAGVLSPEDQFENHIEDTLAAGAGLCDRDIVELVVREAPRQIHDLIRFGTHFDEEDGQLALTREGGHSHRRIVHALGDATGFEVMRALIDRVKRAPNITLWDRRFTIDLVTHEGRCVGLLLNRPRRGKMSVWAKQTILASGGIGVVYRETTNPPVATGDGMAAAFRAGAAMRDMEFMQFHPTVLYLAGSSRYLISEAVRGEGAYLRDKDGRRFMFEDLPEAHRVLAASTEEEGDRFLKGDSAARRPPELSPRDVVSRAIVRCMDRTQHPNVYLDLSHLDPERVRVRFPGIAKVCRGFGLDITRDSIPVRPGAHYMVGGVSVDPQGRTSLPGLWAAGEVTSSGLHGANRLASNSLLEGLVFGAACGRGAAEAAAAMPDRFVVPPVSSAGPTRTEEEIDVADVTNSLRSLMVRKMGIIRHRTGLLEAERTVAFWSRYALGREFDSPAGWELQNLLTVSRLMIWSALQRTESRGTHFRGDYPGRDDDRWQRHLTCPAELPEWPASSAPAPAGVL